MPDPAPPERAPELGRVTDRRPPFKYSALTRVWFSDTDNNPAGVPPLRQLVDEHARAAGRDPADIERTVAVLVRMPRGQGRLDGSGHASRIRPLEGDPEAMAEELRAYAREGIAHVQLVVDPIDLEAIRGLQPVVTALDRT